MRFTLPFSIETEEKDYVLSKLYDQQDAYLLQIPKGVHLENPINIRIKPTAADLDFSLRIELEENSSAVIIEDWSSEVESEYVDFKHDIECHPNSNLKYIILSSASAKTEVSEERTSDIHEDASCNIYSYYFGSKKVDSKLLQKAVGKGANLTTDIIAKSSQKQNLNFNAEHRYTAKNGYGEIGMKAIAQDEGMLNFDGMVNIEQTGGGSAGYLQQETLNLSPNTVVKATPGLKIDTNDVKAGHGSSVRNLNEEDLYYFGARGIDQETAKSLLIAGFLGAEIKKIEKWDTAYQAVRNLI